jgi:colanic acid biosynthesis protein WcaH
MYIPESTYKNITTYLPILCVDLLILHAGKCLLLRRANRPAFGQFWFPGGRVHKLEMLRDAATRIAKEETGLNCVFTQIVTIEETIFPKDEETKTDKHTVNICCMMQLISSHELILLDKFHDSFEWISCIRPDLHLHEAVRRPLSLVGFS